MKKTAALLVLIISFLLFFSCVTEEQAPTEVSFVPEETVIAPDPEPAVEPVVEADVEADVEAVAEPVAEQTEEIAPAVTDGQEPDIWLIGEEDPADSILKHLSIPNIIKPIYKTAVPVVVRGGPECADWEVSLVYRKKVGAVNIYRLKLKSSGYDFTGLIKTGFFPGTELLYSFEVVLPDGRAEGFSGGEAVVLNNGAQAYRQFEILRLFDFDPLFDIGKKGDSSGARLTDHGWDFCWISLSEEIKRWSYELFYRVKGSSDSWSVYGDGRIWDAEADPETGRHQYGLPVKNYQQGDEIEYYFRLKIYDTGQVFELYKDRPLSFSVLRP